KNQVTVIDIPAEVINNFEQIVKEEVTVDGRTFETVEQYITYLTESKGGFTKIVYDETTGDVIFQEWNEVTNTWVNVDNSKFETIVKTNETATQLVANADGTYTYYNEVEIDADGNPIAGTGAVIDIPASVIQNFEEIINNEAVKNELFETIHNTYVGGNVYYNGDTFTYVTEEGETKEITFREIVEANETETTLIKNNDGTYTYTNEK